MDSAEIHSLVVQLPFTEIDIKRMDMLGLSAEEMRDVATIGLQPDMPIHWHRLVSAMIYNYDILDLPNISRL